LSDETTNVITGSIVVTNGWTAELTAYRAVFNAKTNPAPVAGRYTLVIPGEPGSTGVPGGDSYGALSVDLSGLIRLSGGLSDNTKMNQGIAISENGNWPLYVSLYGNQGLIAGWLTFTSMNSATGGIAGNVIWFKPEVVDAKYYPGGFRVSSDVIGSSYVKPFSGAGILNLSGGGSVTFSGGDLAESIVNLIALNVQNGVINQSMNPMNMSFSLANGLLQGSVTDTNLAQKFPFRGVVLQNENYARGYFLGPTRSGEARLEAQ